MEHFTDRRGIKVAVESLIGGRGENQDSYGTAETPLGLLIVVCDGMGGGPAGKTASSVATQAIIDYVATENSKRHKASILADAVTSANKAVLDRVANNPALKGMGTTCVCLLIDDNEAYIAHVGDSRCYQLRGNKMVFRTADHSHVGEMVRHGTLTEEEARTSPYSNVITRAIGGSTTVETELDTVDYRPGDRFALMTDGIWGTMPEPQLVKFLTSGEQPVNLVPQLAHNIDALGKDNGGGHDNLTLAIIDIPGSKLPPYKDTPQSNRINPPQEDLEMPVQVVQSHRETKKDLKIQKSLPILSIVLGVLCVGVVILLFFVLRNRDEKEESKTKLKDFSEQVLTQNKEVTQQSEKESKKSDDQAQPQTSSEKEKTVNEEGKTGVEYYRMAITLLDSLKSYDPPGADLIQRKQERNKICAGIAMEIERGIGCTSDPNEKIQAEKILEDLDRDKKKLLQVDGKQYRSTKESIETIEAFKKRLVSLSSDQ